MIIEVVFCFLIVLGQLLGQNDKILLPQIQENKGDLIICLFKCYEQEHAD